MHPPYISKVFSHISTYFVVFTPTYQHRIYHFFSAYITPVSNEITIGHIIQYHRLKYAAKKKKINYNFIVIYVFYLNVDEKHQRSNYHTKMVKKKVF